MVGATLKKNVQGTDPTPYLILKLVWRTEDAL